MKEGAKAFPALHSFILPALLFFCSFLLSPFSLRSPRHYPLVLFSFLPSFSQPLSIIPLFFLLSPFILPAPIFLIFSPFFIHSPCPYPLALFSFLPSFCPPYSFVLFPFYLSHTPFRGTWQPTLNKLNDSIRFLFVSRPAETGFHLGHLFKYKILIINAMQEYGLRQ